MSIADVNPRAIKRDAEGPWLPLTPELRAELGRRLTTLELTDALAAKCRLRGPGLNRATRRQLVMWLEEKSAGGGLDWSSATMAKYRTILRHVGPPAGDGAHRRQGGFARLTSVAGLASAGSVAAAGRPLAAALVYITWTAGDEAEPGEGSGVEPGQLVLVGDAYAHPARTLDRAMCETYAHNLEAVA